MATQEEIAEIKAALQAKRTGRSVVKVASGSRSVEYDKLTIEQLEAQLAKAESEAAGRRPRGAIKPYF